MDTVKEVRTYAEAVKVAEVITLQELRAALAANSYATVFPAPRKHRVHGESLMVHDIHEDHPEWAFVGFTYDTKTGMVDRDVADVATAIFHLYGIGRYVRVVF